MFVVTDSVEQQSNHYLSSFLSFAAVVHVFRGEGCGDSEADEHFPETARQHEGSGEAHYIHTVCTDMLQ